MEDGNITKEEIEDFFQKRDIVPNSIKFYPGFLKNLFWSYFLYVDSENHTIDNIIEQADIPIKRFTCEFRNDSSEFIFSVLRCRKKDTPQVVAEIFPKLHNANIIKHGKKYLDFCCEVNKVAMNIVMERKGNIDETVS